MAANSEGALLSRQGYKAWGETRFGSLPTKYQFTGQFNQTAIGLYWYGSRWYDPALGRFTQADTIVPGAGNPQAWDRYAYSYGNPVKYIDPTGHWACGNSEYDDTCAENAQDLLQRYAPPPTPIQNSLQAARLRRELITPGPESVINRALQGDGWAIVDLFVPTHVGVRIQIEVSVNLPSLPAGISITIGGNGAYNRNTNQAAGNVDLAVEGGPGIGGGASLIVGPLVGWGSSNEDNITSGASIVASGTAAASEAVAVSVSTPTGSDGALLYIDPKYGVVPVTIYGGVGAGGAYASVGGGLVTSLTPSIDLSFLLPWN